MTTAEHIVASALKLFYRHGFHATGVDLLAEDAGVTKKTLYRHYPGKDALIGAALDLRHRDFMEKMLAFVGRAAIASRPVAYIDFIATWAAEDDFRGCAFINATAEYGERGALPHQQAAAHKQEIRNYLVNICTEGGARKPEKVAASIYLVGEGLIVASQTQEYDETLVESAHSLASRLWKSALGEKMA